MRSVQAIWMISWLLQSNPEDCLGSSLLLFQQGRQLQLPMLAIERHLLGHEFIHHLPVRPQSNILLDVFRDSIAEAQDHI